MAKVVSKTPQVVSLGDMKDGDIAEIVKWHSDRNKPGDLIMRHRNMIIVIGKPSNASYASILETECAEKNKVIILKDGQITIAV